MLFYYTCICLSYIVSRAHGTAHTVSHAGARNPAHVRERFARSYHDRISASAEHPIPYRLRKKLVQPQNDKALFVSLYCLLVSFVSHFKEVFVCIICLTNDKASLVQARTTKPDDAPRPEAPPRRSPPDPTIGRHYLSNATCLIRPHLFYALFTVSRIYNLPTSSPLLKNTCVSTSSVRQVILPGASRFLPTY